MLINRKEPMTSNVILDYLRLNLNSTCREKVFILCTLAPRLPLSHPASLQQTEDTNIALIDCEINERVHNAFFHWNALLTKPQFLTKNDQ